MAILTGWIDYDRPHLAALSATDRIAYLEMRTKLVSTNPLRRILNTEVHPTDACGKPVADSSALLIFGVALCCSIESLGKFIQGDTGTSGTKRSRFNAFLSQYMNADFQSQFIGSNSYGDILWKHFRNGLAHAFTVSHGGYEGVPTDPYFSASSGVLEINPAKLLDDFCNGVSRYITDLQTDQPSGSLYAKFDKVFVDTFINGN